MLYDGATLIGEYNSSHVALRRYVHGPGVDEPLVRYDGTGTSTRIFYHADERGSIVATSDSSGAMANINTYDEYGIPGSGNTGTFQYTGQQWLSDIRMYHYRARIYSPTLGRFMQSDPIGYGDGMNFYAYVGNDPVNHTDPSGMNEPDRMHVFCAGDYCANSGGGGMIVVHGPRRATFIERIANTNVMNDLQRHREQQAERNTGSDGAECPVPGGTGPVHISATIVSPPVGPAYIRGTISNPSTGASASFQQIGLGGVTGVGAIMISGTLSGGFGALSRGFDISGLAGSAGANVRGGVGGGGLGGATLRDYGGGLIGRVDAAIVGVTPGIKLGPITVGGAAFAYDFTPPSLTMTNCPQ